MKDSMPGIANYAQHYSESHPGEEVKIFFMPASATSVFHYVRHKPVHRLKSAKLSSVRAITKSAATFLISYFRIIVLNDLGGRLFFNFRHI